MPANRLGSVPQTFLNIAFVFALLLGGICLFVSAFYLYRFLQATSAGLDPMVQSAGTNQTPGALEVMINGRLVMARISLLSCGIFVGIAFGFVGFSMCLLGIKESVDVDLTNETYKARFVRLSPGVLIIICSTILTGVCATRETPFWYKKTLEAGATTQTDSTRDVPTQSGDFSNKP
jgi:hypothetical protein